MEQSLSRILVEVAVKTALKNIKDNSERGIRNIVDMALQCTEGRFQRKFFSTAQTMLQNENSAYYELVRDTVTHTDTRRILTFGMNLGYNACTIGAQQIRENEAKLHCNIPWTVLLRVDTRCMEDTEQNYHKIIQEGETLGIYAWMLFAADHAQALLSLAKAHPDSAFCIFCEAEDCTDAFLDEAAALYNIMLVVRYAENTAALCRELRKRALLYSVWYLYGPDDTAALQNGDLFDAMQQLTPVFAVFISQRDCPEAVQNLAHRSVQCARNAQTIRTILWEMRGDNRLIDTIISDDACSVYFDEKGDLFDQNRPIKSPPNNLFQDSLTNIFRSAYPKAAAEKRPSVPKHAK